MFTVQQRPLNNVWKAFSQRIFHVQLEPICLIALSEDSIHITLLFVFEKKKYVLDVLKIEYKRRNSWRISSFKIVSVKLLRLKSGFGQTNSIGCWKIGKFVQKLKFKDQKMSKFKVVAYNKAFFIWLGVRFDRLSLNTNEFFRSFLPYCFLIVCISSVISSAVFIYTNWPNLEIVLQSASIVFFAMIQTNGMFFGFGSKIKRVKETHFRLQAIVDDQGNWSSIWRQ